MVVIQQVGSRRIRRSISKMIVRNIETRLENLSLSTPYGEFLLLDKPLRAHFGCVAIFIVDYWTKAASSSHSQG